ncbi:MAG: hypothetical protein PUC04_00050 [Firmicutes bacterium]|jgi:hypothetical protein|nr:hypothetical protein [Oscillospiraceae bacterium]MDD6245317.1 hypothetical protein [Bacillota bacterium]MDY2808047.1 hypothetical protein [Oscillospiraceae bacterium]CDB88051.1 putative ATPase [Firmicutes bacterium CAG:170]
MKSWEVVREIENQCANNQMRDVFFDEIETDDPVEWVRREVKGKQVELRADRTGEGRMTVFVESGGVCQKFLFTEL